MAVSEQRIREALAGVAFPGFTRDLVSLGVVLSVTLEGESVRVELDPGVGEPAVGPALERAARAALEALAGIGPVAIALRPRGGSPALRLAGGKPPLAGAGALDPGLIPEVACTLAVASGKGGVGKSTVAVNLAVAFSRLGLRTGLLDADIYGPSVPIMTGIHEQPRLTAERRLEPFERFGVRLMSLGFLVDPASAVIWRGPMVMKAIDQLLREVAWGALDVLVVDLPPGTGDAQLTLAQRVRLAGAVIVTTPQDVALADARKGVAMFNKVGVPVLGIVENMSYFVCPACAARAEIFGHGGGREEARRLGVPFLGEVPLDTAVRTGGDAGEPIVDRAPDSPPARALRDIAERLRDELLDRAAESGDRRPEGLLDRLRDRWRRPRA